MRITLTLTVAAAAASLAIATTGTTEPATDEVDCDAIAESLASGEATGETDVTAWQGAVAMATGSAADAIEGPLTAFVPTDEAFAEIPQNVMDSLLADEALLTTLVDAHVIVGESLSVADLAATGEATTADGSPRTFALDDDVLTIDDGAASVVCPDLEAEGATVHVIDGVLQPAGTAGDVASSSVPGSSVPALTPEEQAVATAFETAVDSSLSYEQQAPFIEDAEQLRETIENYPAAAEVVMGISADVTSVEIDGDTAAITYVLFFNGVDAGYGELDGTMVNVDGSWVVPRDEYCAFQAQARNSCPA